MSLSTKAMIFVMCFLISYICGYRYLFFFCFFYFFYFLIINKYHFVYALFILICCFFFGVCVCFFKM